MRILSVVICIVLLLSCDGGSVQPANKKLNLKPTDFSKRQVAELPTDRKTLKDGKTYLAVYSEIYSNSERTTHPLTATIGIHNVNPKDTIFIKRANYYQTNGDLLRNYTPIPIQILPHETVEIVIHEGDKTGGTGANFVFEWLAPTLGNPPLIEAVMISTYGQQGLSFTTRGIEIK